jgi:hypothetical protein
VTTHRRCWDRVLRLIGIFFALSCPARLSAAAQAPCPGACPSERPPKTNNLSIRRGPINVVGPTDPLPCNPTEAGNAPEAGCAPWTTQPGNGGSCSVGVGYRPRDYTFTTTIWVRSSWPAGESWSASVPDPTPCAMSCAQNPCGNFSYCMLLVHECAHRTEQETEVRAFYVAYKRAIAGLTCCAASTPKEEMAWQTFRHAVAALDVEPQKTANENVACSVGCWYQQDHCKP